MRALHLVEDGVVRSVNLVSPVHVCAEEPSVQSLAVALDLVCAGVRAQHVVLVEVVAVRRAASRVVRGEAELIKVLPHGDGGGAGRERGVRRKVFLDDLAQDRDRVGGQQVEVAVRLGEDGGGRVRVHVPGIALAVDHVRFSPPGGRMEAGEGETGAGAGAGDSPATGRSRAHKGRDDGGHGGGFSNEWLQMKYQSCLFSLTKLLPSRFLHASSICELSLHF